jgi:hypothetical protein
MKLSEVKQYLSDRDELVFRLPDGTAVARHFHVTEVGVIRKHFIDCGGTVRHETVANFQLWQADDYDHRLAPGKLLGIIELSERQLGMEDWEVEVEYQGETIGKYGLEAAPDGLWLTTKSTDCLARDQCGVPPAKTKLSLNELVVTNPAGGCAPGSGCC